MKTNIFKFLLVSFLLLAAAIWIMGQCDYSRLSDGKRPLFARWTMYEADGGSIQYCGFGYAVTKMHRITGGWDFSNPDKTTFQTGYALDFWTPFISRENTSLIVVTNR
jgi:hypothetical protein